QAHVLQAMTFRNLDRFALADDELRAALRTDPEFKLDPDEYSPTLRARLEKLRRDLSREPKGELQITSDPPGARLFLDGRDAGTTPFREPAAVGTHGVVLMVGSKTTFSRTITVQKDKLLGLRIDAAFESSVYLRPSLCVQDISNNAIKLAALIDANEV